MHIRSQLAVHAKGCLSRRSLSPLEPLETADLAGPSATTLIVSHRNFGRGFLAAASGSGLRRFARVSSPQVTNAAQDGVKLLSPDA